jgi:hypothetical protein
MKMRMLLVLGAALALTVGVATAGAGSGNSDAAKACQKGGWQNLVRQDGTGFKNAGDCISYAAQGGTLKPKPVCAGSEDFSADDEFSQPSTFPGGTIDGPYGVVGGVVVQGSFWSGGFAPGTHLLFTGLQVNSLRLSFTNAVGAVHLDAQGDSNATTHLTLTGYDASNAVVATDTATDSTNSVHTLSVSSATNNIKYFTMATDDPAAFGVAFTNIVWTCN